MPDTTNYEWVLPTPGADDGTWGGILNTAFEAIDTDLKLVEDKADAVLEPEVDTIAIGAAATVDLDVSTRRFFTVATTGFGATARLVNAPPEACSVYVRVAVGSALWIPAFTADAGAVLFPGGAAATTIYNASSHPYLVHLVTFSGGQTWLATIIGSNYGGS
jgi:hypothetical protein